MNNNQITNHQFRGKQFFFGQLAGLELHLSYILQKVHLKELLLYDLSTEQTDLVFRQLQLNRTRVLGEMRLRGRVPSPFTLMPTANCVKKLYIHRAPEGFYQHPAIRQLYELGVSHLSEIQMDDDDLCQLKAAEIHIERGAGQLTERGIRSFIMQWCEGKRTIESLSLEDYVRESSRRRERNKWMSMALSLNAKLVQVGGSADSRSCRRELSLLRLPDGASIIINWRHDHLLSNANRNASEYCHYLF